MASKDQHVVAARNGGWSVRTSGAARATRAFQTRDEAVAFARDLAKRDGVELYVHGRDGTVREKTSFAFAQHALKSA